MEHSQSIISGKKIGISISESENLGQFGLGEMHLHSFLIEIARKLLLNGAHLVYGGNLSFKPDPDSNDFNYTYLLMDLVATMKLDKTKGPPIINYAAYPYSEFANVSIKARYVNEVRFEKTKLDPAKLKFEPSDLSEDSIGKEYLSGDYPEASLDVANCLTDMRKKRNDEIEAAIFMGGKFGSGKKFRGWMPGLLEEFVLAITKRNPMPVYLCGGLGGCSGLMTRIFLEDGIPIELKPKRQFEMNPRLKKLTADFPGEQKGHSIQMAVNTILNFKDRLNAHSYNRINHMYEDDQWVSFNGLTWEENKILMTSYNPLEVIHYILKGLNNYFK